MIKNLLLLLISCLVAISTSHGQTAATPATATTWSIGSPDNPVIAAEYDTFLTDSNAPQAESTLEDVEEKFIGDAIPIAVSGDVGSCSFLLKNGDTNVRINAVPSQEAQAAFNKWRKNPLSKELLSYLNDQVKIHWRTVSPGAISNYKNDAGLIKTRYPDSEVFSTADYIAANYSRSNTYYFVNDLPKEVLDVPGTKMLNLDYDVKNFSTTDYHRPVNIQVN